MTELETLERAKMYMEKLANGINPIDGVSISEIAITLKRNSGSVRARLKKLGITE